MDFANATHWPKPRGRKDVTDEWRREFVAAYKSGLSVQGLADKFELSVPRVKWRLQMMGYSTKGRT